MNREEFITEVAKLLAGLQMPVSLGTSLGTAREPWEVLHRDLHGFGWSAPELYEEAVRKILSQETPGASAPDDEAPAAGGLTMGQLAEALDKLAHGGEAWGRNMHESKQVYLRAGRRVYPLSQVAASFRNGAFIVVLNGAGKGAEA